MWETAETCQEGFECKAAECVETVIPCQPDCDGKDCGGDGCDGTCGKCFTLEGAPDDSLCQPDGTCCMPDCAGKQCGLNGCGGECGTCPDGKVCNDGVCELSCIPQCEGKECGDDGCDGSCGTCYNAAGAIDESLCQDSGACCEPNCGLKDCGNDGCGGSCGTCAENEKCISGFCEEQCIQQCEGKECGYDGCTGTCGFCSDGDVCEDGQCVPCEPDCTDKVCGKDGCGGSCGECDEGLTCVEFECLCVPTCDEKECGSDGCEGDCGTCDDGNPCTADTCVENLCVFELLPLEELAIEECVCASDEDCAPLEDGDLCNGTLMCEMEEGAEIGVCKVDEETIVTCTDDLFCNGLESCEPDTGECVEGEAPELGDEIDCTIDSCDEELDEIVHTADDIACDDENECTVNTCDPVAGCGTVNVDNEIKCGELAGESCVDGECICQADCEGLECGDDGCDGSCGECGENQVCTDGACVGTMEPGSACDTSDVCASGFCVDGYCCDAACAAQCQACDVADQEGVCVNYADDTDPGNECGPCRVCSGEGACKDVAQGEDTKGDCEEMEESSCGYDGTCNGAGMCAYWAEQTVCEEQTCTDHTLYEVDYCSGLGVCVDGGTMDCCPYVCGDDECRAVCAADQHCCGGFYCSEQACLAKKADGTVCDAAGECESGLCVDGVCCNTNCDGLCEGCNEDGNAGICTLFAADSDPENDCSPCSVCSGSGNSCVNVPNGEDPAGDCTETEKSSCGYDGTCNGAGMCALWADGTTCEAGSCEDGLSHVEDTCDGVGACEDSGTESCEPFVCDAQGTDCLAACSDWKDCADGYYCQDPLCLAKKGDGENCAAPEECLSGECTLGICGD